MLGREVPRKYLAKHQDKALIPIRRMVPDSQAIGRESIWRPPRAADPGDANGNVREGLGWRGMGQRNMEHGPRDHGPRTVERVERPVPLRVTHSLTFPRCFQGRS
jgi:hypothetical protein